MCLNLHTGRFMSVLLPALVVLAFASQVQAQEKGNLLKRQPAFGANPNILPVDEAFRFSLVEKAEGSKVFWRIMSGYFLYREKFSFIVDGKQVSVALPAGELRQDEVFGEVHVLDGLVEATLPAGEIIEVGYQGCAAIGYCYPPQNRVLTTSIMPPSSYK